VISSFGFISLNIDPRASLKTKSAPMGAPLFTDH